MAGARSEEFFKLEPSDGVFLDAGLTLPDSPSVGVVVCHPDPRGGGNMYNSLIETIVRKLAAGGAATLRFDFRVPGSFDERLQDASAALAHVRSRLSADSSVAMVGWSMGAEIALAVAGSDPGVQSVVAICPLLFPNLAPRRESLRDRKLLLLVPEFDQFTPPDVARQRIDFGTFEVISDGDHSLFGREDEIAERALSFLISS